MNSRQKSHQPAERPIFRRARPISYLTATREGLVAQGEKVGVKSDPDINPDILSLQQLLIYGIKGVAAYADHAAILGQKMKGCMILFMKPWPQP